jgi:hypothetical protein
MARCFHPLFLDFHPTASHRQGFAARMSRRGPRARRCIAAVLASVVGKRPAHRLRIIIPTSAGGRVRRCTPPPGARPAYDQYGQQGPQVYSAHGAPPAYDQYGRQGPQVYSGRGAALAPDRYQGRTPHNCIEMPRGGRGSGTRPDDLLMSLRTATPCHPSSKIRRSGPARPRIIPLRQRPPRKAVAGLVLRYTFHRERAEDRILVADLLLRIASDVPPRLDFVHVLELENDDAVRWRLAGYRKCLIAGDRARPRNRRRRS